MQQIKQTTARFLLDCKAVILRPAEPFTWASGWRSPIYCDNRITLSHPEIRTYIKESIAALIRVHFGTPGLIAGVATGAIAQGALVAEMMDLPFVYVRAEAKSHGRQNLVEGKINKGQQVVVVEDLVSTGGSSLKAVEAIREEGGEVLGMVAVFSYGFQTAVEAFRHAGVTLVTLSDYESLVGLALETGYIKPQYAGLLENWRRDPSGWTGQ